MFAYVRMCVLVSGSGGVIGPEEAWTGAEANSNIAAATVKWTIVFVNNMLLRMRSHVMQHHLVTFLLGADFEAELPPAVSVPACCMSICLHAMFVREQENEWERLF